MHDRLRILYAAGPGNVIGTFRHWKAGRDDPSQLAITYSGQFYDSVIALDATAYVIASSRIPGRVWDRNFRIEHRALPFENYTGPLYHLGQIWYGLGLFVSAVRYRADIAVVCGGTHWFLLSLLTLFRIRVISSLHCTLWRDYVVKSQARNDLIRRIIRRLDGWFFRSRGSGILSVSDEVTRQVRIMCDNDAQPVSTFIPIYRRATFAGVATPPPERTPFRVLFVGRIERNKGVFDLKKIAHRFSVLGRTDIEFDLCGSGAAFDELASSVQALGLAARFRLHGHCDRDKLREMYGKSHVVIAPTHTDFLEGFNKVVIEGVLAGRPVITSNVCPSLSLVRDAVVEVEPDDVIGYGNAIKRLCDDIQLYDRLSRGASIARERFYDQNVSWGTLLRALIVKVGGREGRANVDGKSHKRSIENLTISRSRAREKRPAAKARLNFGGVLAVATLGVLCALLGFVTTRPHPTYSTGSESLTAPAVFRWSFTATTKTPANQNTANVTGDNIEN